MSNKLGYQLYSVRHPNEADSRMFPPGLFQWVEAFNRYGKFGKMNANIKKDNLEESDVIHVNVTPTNISYLAALREELGISSSTMLIANVDFGILMWSGIDPLVLRSMLSKADMVFHVESTGANRLERLLGRKVYTIPHPVNVEDIKAGAVTGENNERSPVISCQYHRYADTWVDYYYGLVNIRKDYPEISTVLMNYVAPEKGPRVPCICMFNELLSTMPYPEYMEILRKVLINVDVTFDYTYGRGIVEAAALKIPTVGSSTIEAQRVMLPELAITPGKDDEMEAAIQDLLENDEYREKMAQQAYENCEIYSLKSSYDKMATVLEEIS